MNMNNLTQYIDAKVTKGLDIKDLPKIEHVKSFLRHELQEYQKQVKKMVEEMQIKCTCIEKGQKVCSCSEWDAGFDSALSDILSHPLLNNK